MYPREELLSVAVHTVIGIGAGLRPEVTRVLCAFSAGPTAWRTGMRWACATYRWKALAEAVTLGTGTSVPVH